jgi:gliding motility-associated-like protein
VNVVDANGCSVISGQQLFPVGSSSSISSSFTASATQGSVPLDVLFTSTTTTVTSYNWSLGNGTTTGGSPFAQATYTTAGTYTVMLTTSYGTCISTSTLSILVEGTPDVVIPNIFSPNGDNINDQFSILSVGVTDLHADIFNRWGTLIHTLSGVSDTWDGKSNGNQNASEGTYYIVLTAKTIDGKTLDKQGFVTLVR